MVTLYPGSTKSIFDILQKGGKFIGKVNCLLQEFHYTSPPILTQVINTFATSFYGSSLSDIISSECEKLDTSRNVTVRQVFNLNRKTHRYLIEPLFQCLHAKTMIFSRFVTFQKSLLNSSKLNVRFLAKVNVNDQRTLLGRTLQKMSSLAECGTMWRRTSSTSRHQGQRHGEYQCWRSYWWQGRGKCLLGTWTPVKFINYGTSYVPHENYWAPYGGLAFPLDPQVLPPTCQFLQKTQFHHPTLLPAYKIKHLFIYNVGPIVLF